MFWLCPFQGMLPEMFLSIVWPVYFDTTRGSQEKAFAAWTCETLTKKEKNITRKIARRMLIGRQLGD